MFKKIILGLDGSESSARAIPFATDLAKRYGGEIVIVHIEEDIVGKGGGPIHFDEDEIQAEVRRSAEALSEEGLEAKVRMTSVFLGGPAKAIATIADEEGADLIVVGSRGLSALGGVLLGSVAQRLLHLAGQPVLVITPQSQPAETAAAGSGREAARA